MFVPRHVGKDEFRQCIEDVRRGAAGEQEGLFGPGSMIWRVASVAPVYLTGTTQAAFMDVAHPWIAAGVAEHSTIFTDPRGRARRTYRTLTTIIFGDLPAVVRTARGLYTLHERVTGTVSADDGAFGDAGPYRANEVHALRWVHAASWWVRRNLYESLVGPLSTEERDQLVAETVLYARCFGLRADQVPHTNDELDDYILEMTQNGQLAASDASRRIMQFLSQQIPAGLRSGMLAFNSLMLPGPIRTILELPEDSPTTRARHGRLRRALRLACRLPRPVAKLPPAREAQARLHGRRPGVTSRLVGRVLAGPSSSPVSAVLDAERD